jgi:hypothetical protein
MYLVYTINLDNLIGNNAAQYKKRVSQLMTYPFLSVVSYYQLALIEKIKFLPGAEKPEAKYL